MPDCWISADSASCFRQRRGLGAWTVVDDVCRVRSGRPAVARMRRLQLSLRLARRRATQRRADQSEPETANVRPRRWNSSFCGVLPLWKRVIDVPGASVGLLLLSPLFAIVATAIKATSPGPVFFRQSAAGWAARSSSCVKFRSMVPDAEARKRQLMAFNEQDGPAFKIKNDPRVTRLGRFMRRTSIDELPQLWNVLRGDMSLVGPRPLPCNEAESCRGWLRQRLDVTPGLTCIWQVRGRSTVSLPIGCAWTCSTFAAARWGPTSSSCCRPCRLSCRGKARHERRHRIQRVHDMHRVIGCGKTSIAAHPVRRILGLAFRINGSVGDCPNFRPSENGTVPFATHFSNHGTT